MSKKNELDNILGIGIRKDYDETKRVVKQELITFQGKIYYVSTVDLMFYHSFGGGPPLYYETMIFLNNDDFKDMYFNRYSTRDEALKGHEELVADILDGQFYISKRGDDEYFEKKE